MHNERPNLFASDSPGAGHRIMMCILKRCLSQSSDVGSIRKCITSLTLAIAADTIAERVSPSLIVRWGQAETRQSLICYQANPFCAMAVCSIRRSRLYALQMHRASHSVARMTVSAVPLDEKLVQWRNCAFEFWIGATWRNETSSQRGVAVRTILAPCETVAPHFVDG